jgi:hypothetical protein
MTIVQGISGQFSTFAQAEKPDSMRVLVCTALVQAFYLFGLLIRWFWVRAPGHPSIFRQQKKDLFISRVE